jgi:hypothetical protein
MNSYEVKKMFENSEWDYTEAQWEAIADNTRGINPYHPEKIYLAVRTKPTPEKLVSLIRDNQPREKKSYGCVKCDKGDIKVCKLDDIPSWCISTPILYPKMNIPCPFCQDKTRFVNYLKKAIELDKIVYVIAYLDVSDRLNLLYPVILEVMSNEYYQNILKASRKMWNAPAFWNSAVQSC